VIQSVEEATLSRRISDSAAVDENHCLLLFKDVDQLHAEEDEGFHAAVAQLITASCRPIVMTLSHHNIGMIDPKIFKKDPLYITFQLPPPTAIVKKVLLPILERELEHQDPSFDLDNHEHESDKRHLSSLLSSLVRHSASDIRKSLNQLQFLWSTRALLNLTSIHRDLCPLIDPELILPARPAEELIPKTKRKTKAERLLELKQLDELSEKFQLLTDLDRLSTTLDTLRDDNEPSPVSYRILPYSELSIQTLTGTDNAMLRALTFETDEDKSRAERWAKLYDELCSYVDHVDNYDGIAYVRTIVKSSVLHSVGTQAKRNGRIKPYFNRLGRDFIDRMCNTFDFKMELAIYKVAHDHDSGTPSSSRR
jgi:hypothetical protein